MGGDLVIFLTGSAPQPTYTGKPCGPKIFKANQITLFFYTKLLKKDFFYEFIFCMALRHNG